MEQVQIVKKSNSIKVVGFLIMVASVFIIVTNVLGAITIIDLIEEGVIDLERLENQDPELKTLVQILKNYMVVITTIIVLALLFFMGGLGLLKKKIIGAYISSFVILIFLIGIWLSTYFIFRYFSIANSGSHFGITTILNAVFWSLPLIFLIWYLNRKSLREYLD